MTEPVETPARTPAAYDVGDRINVRYEVLAVLGSGAFSTVYRVFDSARGHECALKVFGPNYGLDVARRELRALMSLRHPNVVEVIDVGQTTSQPSLWFLKSEFVDGELLTNFTDPDGERLPADDAIAVADQILDALQTIHPQTDRIEELKSRSELDEGEYEELIRLQASGLIHRDIKPQNIIRTHNGTVKLLDFNIATPAGAAVLTTSGTPAYTPPEVNFAAWDVSPDLFAVGVVLYELLTQSHPYPDRQPRPNFEPSNPSELNSEVPRPVGEVVRRMCMPDRQFRFSSAFEARRALSDSMRTEGGSARPSGFDPAETVERIMGAGTMPGGQRLELSHIGPGVWGVLGSPDGYSVELHLSPDTAMIELSAHSQGALQRLRERDESDLLIVGVQPDRVASGSQWVVPTVNGPEDAPDLLATALVEAFLVAVDIVERGSTDTTIPALPLGEMPDGHHRVGWITTSDVRVPLVVVERSDPAGVDLSAMTASGVRRYPAPRGAYLWGPDGRALPYETLVVAKWTVGTGEPLAEAGDSSLTLTWSAPITGLASLESLTVTVEERDGSAFVTASGELKRPETPVPSEVGRPLASETAIDQFVESRAPDEAAILDVLRHLVTDASELGLEWELGRSSNSPDGLGAYAMLRIPGQGAEGQIGFLWPASHRLDLRLDRAWAHGRTFAGPRKSARANAFQVQVDLRSEPARAEALELLKLAVEQVSRQ